MKKLNGVSDTGMSRLASYISKKGEIPRGSSNNTDFVLTASPDEVVQLILDPIPQFGRIGLGPNFSPEESDRYHEDIAELKNEFLERLWDRALELAPEVLKAAEAYDDTGYALAGVEQYFDHTSKYGIDGKF